MPPNSSYQLPAHPKPASFHALRDSWPHGIREQTTCHPPRSRRYVQQDGEVWVIIGLRSIVWRCYRICQQGIVLLHRAKRQKVLQNRTEECQMASVRESLGSSFVLCSYPLSLFSVLFQVAFIA